jgi:GrpB-like predicted nucleotidyltransferase (UPF0157 family)
VTPVEIVEYDPRWPAEFERLAARVADLMGPAALSVDHIGSTSVPGLAAKDRIDIQVAVERLDALLLRAAVDGSGLRAASEVCGDHVPAGADGDDDGWAKLLFTWREPQERAANVHVRVLGAANWRYALLFRDHLRAHPVTAAAYAELKRRLAALGIDGDIYSDVKDPACDLIIEAAESWAAATGWQPPPLRP